MKKETANHMKAYRQYIKTPKVNRTECEAVVGSDAQVDAFAQFYMLNAESLNVLGEYLVYDFLSKDHISSADAKVFKEAIGKFGAFFVKCANEKELRKRLTQHEIK